MGTEIISQLDWPGLFEISKPLLVLLVTAVILIVTAALTEEDSGAPVLIAIAGLLLSAFLSWQLMPATHGYIMMMFAFDRISFLGWLISIFLALLTVFISIPYLKLHKARNADYFALLILATFGMATLASGVDLVSILICIEIMSIASYTLTGYTKNRPTSIEGAFKYFLMGAFATAFLGMGIAFLFGSLGTTDLALMAVRAKEVMGGGERSFFLFGVAMVSIGFAFKVALIPFHAWAPDAYDGAPTPIAAFMATGIKAAAFIAFFRFAIAAGIFGGQVWHDVMWVLALATTIGGNIAAIRQDNLKRMLAYSSIAHAGYIFTLFPSLASGSSGAWNALILYLVAYTIITMGAFASLIALEPEMGEPVQMTKLNGLARRRPVLAAAFSLFLVSLAGFPPTLGFFGKYYLFLAVVKNGDVGLVVGAVVASVVSVYFYLRPVVAMYFLDAEENAGADTMTQKYFAIAAPVVAVIAVAAIATIIFGILPQNLVALAQSATG